jgi:hypothetical protein
VIHRHIARYKGHRRFTIAPVYIIDDRLLIDTMGNRLEEIEVGKPPVLWIYLPVLYVMPWIPVE